MENMRLQPLEIARLKSTPELDSFIEALRDRELSFKASGLIEARINTYEALQHVVHRAMKICTIAGIDVSEHFKRIYVSDSNREHVAQDWMLSKFAYILVLLNCNPANPTVGEIQIQLIRNFVQRSFS
jgi:hypothetical protein